MFGIFVHYSTRLISDVSMNLFCWSPSVDSFNILPGFLWQPLLNQYRRMYNWDLISHPLPSNLNCKTKTKLQALDGQLNENRTLVIRMWANMKNKQ